jgi:hypothetical protein
MKLIQIGFALSLARHKAWRQVSKLKISSSAPTFAPCLVLILQCQRMTTSIWRSAMIVPDEVGRQMGQL